MLENTGMRVALTAVLGLVVVVAFFAFFALSSVVGYVEESDRLVATTRSAKLRATLVDMATDVIHERIEGDPGLRSMPRPQLRNIVDEVIAPDWFEDSVRSSHETMRKAIRDAHETAVVDLRATKEALRTALRGLRDRAQGSCEQLLGPACANQTDVDAIVRSYETAGVAAVDQIVDEVDLFSQMTGRQRARAHELRKGFESLETVRMLALAALVMSFAVVIVLNIRPWRRLLLSTGSILVVASAFYLATVDVFIGLALRAMDRQIMTEGALREEDRAARVLVDFAERMIADSVNGSTTSVALLGLAGLVAILLVILSIRLGRRA